MDAVPLPKTFDSIAGRPVNANAPSAPLRARKWRRVKAVFANVLNYAGDLFAFNNRLMNRLPKQLYKFAQTGCQRNLQGSGQRVEMRGMRIRILSTLMR